MYNVLRNFPSVGSNLTYQKTIYKAFSPFLFRGAVLQPKSRAALYMKNKAKIQANGLIITGKSGVGKTHLAGAIANRLIETDKIVLMGRLTTLLDMIKETFRDNTKSENELIELYSNVDMIIIDDLGTERISSWALEKLYTIIQNRFENGLPIIITTRFDKNGLISRFSYSNDQDLIDATISKLYQKCYGITLKSMKKELV